MSDAIFGPVVPDAVIEDLMLNKLIERLPDYLAFMRRRFDLDFDLKKPTSWGIPAQRYEKWPEKMTPHVMVISAGTEGTPALRAGPEGRREYSAVYGFETTVAVSAPTPKATEKLAKLYIAAIELVINKHPVGDPVEQIEWRGHTPEDLGDKERSMVAMTARWGVLASGVMNQWPGPAEPAEDPTVPLGDYPLAEMFELDVEHKEDDED